jgi:hypothetical protein
MCPHCIGYGLKFFKSKENHAPLGALFEPNSRPDDAPMKTVESPADPSFSNHPSQNFGQSGAGLSEGEMVTPAGQPCIRQVVVARVTRRF